MPVVVIDTNIFVSALLGSSSCHTIYGLFKTNRFQLAISPSLLAELNFVLSRSKFQNLFTKEETATLIDLIKLLALFVPATSRVRVCRDAKDNRVLECDLDAKADFIVSGDRDVLVLSPFHGIEILPPVEFIQKFKMK